MNPLWTVFAIGLVTGAAMAWGLIAAVLAWRRKS